MYGDINFLLQCFPAEKFLPYSIECYKKDERNKIQMVCDIVGSLPSPKDTAYDLCDLWFTNQKV